MVNEWNGRLTQASVGACWPEASMSMAGPRKGAPERPGGRSPWASERVENRGKIRGKKEKSNAMMRVEQCWGPKLQDLAGQGACEGVSGALRRAGAGA